MKELRDLKDLTTHDVRNRVDEIDLLLHDADGVGHEEGVAVVVLDLQVRPRLPQTERED